MRNDDLPAAPSFNLKNLRDEKAELERQLQAQAAEFADLQRLVREKEAEARRAREVAGEAAKLIERVLTKRALFFIPMSLLPRRTRRRLQVWALRHSGLFDAQWYLRRYPDVAAAGKDPVRHYIEYGRKEGRAPSPLLDVTSQASESSGAVRAKDDEYAVIQEVFDRNYYLRRYPDVASARIDPVQHFIEYGAREGRDPSPEFNTKYYVRRYPDVASSGLNPYYHYLAIGRTEGRGATPFSAGEPNFDTMCEMLGRPPAEVAKELSERRRDLRARLENGVLGEMVRRAGELEPLIHQSWLAAMNVRIPPFQYEQISAQIAAIYRLQNAAGRRRSRAVIALRSCGMGGVTRIAGHLSHALAKIYSEEEIVIVSTDVGKIDYDHWFPRQSRVIDFASTAQSLGANDRQKLLVEFLRSLHPAAVFNMNSRLLWDATTPYGKALAKSSALYAYMFCNDLDIYGHSVGYPNRNFYRHFDVLSAVITDSNFLADDLRTRFQVSPDKSDKLVVLNTPIEESLPISRAPQPSADRRPQIYWAGRFDRQKRVDIVAKIAARLPEIDFHLWGEPVLDGAYGQLNLPENVFVEGKYENFCDLPLEQCDLWLYTSQWDGVPNVLFEVASAGIPLVGSVAGGCGEVLVHGLCERIEDVEDVAAFIVSIRKVLADPAVARAKATRLRERTLTERSPALYRAQVERLLSQGKAA